jgi:hypothetical protein
MPPCTAWANQRAAARMLELLDETGTDLSDKALHGAWRDGGRCSACQRALEWLPVSEAAMDRALEVQRLLAAYRGNGHRRPIPDLIIAAPAELHGAEGLHVYL